MNAERLLALFERISEAPDAIPRLRRFILDLAVRGKLVEQDPEDEPAGELLLELQSSRQKSGLRGTKLSRGSRLSDMVEPGHAIPESWMWAPIGMIFAYDAGTKVEPNNLEQDSWLLELEDLEKDSGKLLTRSTVGDRLPQSTKSSFKTSDILYSKLRPYLNKVFVADRPGYSSTEIVALRAFSGMCPEYCALALRRPDFVRYVTLLGQGTKMPRLRTEDAVIAPFPLPPLAEQHRIVAKVDELMALCDLLEAARMQRAQCRERLVAASLQRLNQPSDDPEAFRSDARFALQVLPSLTTTPVQIKQLRQTILNLAVRGKLVEQDPEDEPAEELLNRIRAETTRKRVSAKGNLICIAEANGIPADASLPTGWSWIRLDQIALSMRYGTSTKCEYQAAGVPVLRIPNVSSGVLCLDDIKHGLLSEVEKRDLALDAGDILMIRSNGSLDNVGRSAIVTDAGRGMAFAGYLVRLRLSRVNISSEFIWLALNSTDVRNQIEIPIRSAVGLKNVNLTEFGRLAFPLPPLAEQHRIVAKVDELMALCDQLEQQLSQGEESRRGLLEAVLQEALRDPRADLALVGRA